MIQKNSPHLEHFCHLSYKLPIWVSFCPDGVSFCPKYHTQPLISPHTPVSGICTYTKHPKAYPKIPLFLFWTWKWANWRTVWASQTPKRQNVWKMGKPFREVGNFYYYSHYVCVRDCRSQGWDRKGARIILWLQRFFHCRMCSKLKQWNKLKVWVYPSSLWLRKVSVTSTPFFIIM